MVAKLHEVLAVEGDLEATAKKVMEEAVNTFTKKPDHFMEQHRSLTMFDDNRAQENTDEHKALVTTVGEKLGYVRRSVTKYLDTFARKEATNQTASADLVVDGETLASDIPATMLLGLESKLKTLRGMYDAIPTLQPGVHWEIDADRGQDIYVGVDPEVRMRTEKQVQHKVLYEATKEHPAQLERWNADVPVGKITLRSWSGMLSPADKSHLLGRIDTLLRGVKKARQRANTAEVVSRPIGDVLFDYIHA